jgi:F-box protein 11
VQGALDYADERGATSAGSSDGNNGHSALVFLHAGTYRGEFLVIDSNVALIGAAPGNVAESVILERESESTIMFVEGAKHAYAGHLTLKFSPDVTSTVPHHKHYCLEVGENCSPTIDHCIIRSTSVGEYCKHVRCDKLMLCTWSCILYWVPVKISSLLS